MKKRLKKRDSLKKTFLFLIFLVIMLTIMFYIFLYFNFKTGDFFYDKEKGIGEVKGISVFGNYYVSWENGNYTKESIFDLYSSEKINKIDIVKIKSQKKSNPPSIYPVDNGKKAMVIDSEENKTEVITNFISGDEKRGEFLLKINEKNCKHKIDCNEWSECKMLYNLNTIINKDFEKGIRYRNCRDLNNCYPDFTESQKCNPLKEIKMNKTTIGNQTIITILDKNNKKISTLNLENNQLTNINI